MTKMQKFYSILSVGICLLTCLLSFVIYFALKPNRSKADALISVADINLKAGESAEIEYELLFNDAHVEFSITDESIARVEDLSVQALKQGVTFLSAKVSRNGTVYFAIAQVKVVDNQFIEDDNNNNNEDKEDNKPSDNEDKANPEMIYCQIVPIKNCTYVNNVLSVNGTATFLINFYSDKELTNLMNFNEYKIVTPSSIVVDKEFNMFIITAKEDSSFFIAFYDFGGLIEVKVQKLG